jgi:hypothetical protein
MITALILFSALDDRQTRYAGRETAMMKEKFLSLFLK